VAADRCGFHAARIRKLQVDHRSSLCRALSSSGGPGDASGVTGAEKGLVGSNREGSERPAPLLLQRLLMLHETMQCGKRRNGIPLMQVEDKRQNQAVLRGYISPQLVQLRCFLTEDVLDCLSSLQAPLSNPQRPLLLRKLTLKGARNEWERPIDIEKRLLAWLSQKPSPTPHLTSVVLGDIFYNTGLGLPDAAFGHYASRESLRRLWLYTFSSEAQEVVSQKALEDIIFTKLSQVSRTVQCCCISL
jgi:hypothetical protein